MRNISVNYFELEPVVQEMSFKDILSRAMASILFC